ncbi:uncharacterized protein LOC134763158 [Penaeus indicus]|uniref:uncharacterized protein LOC134763158 n=1 Tax=Penaeus indicus TaxID=29960 RepID=UPI00300C1619
MLDVFNCGQKPWTDNQPSQPNIFNGSLLLYGKHFTYLGSTLSRDNILDKKIKRGINVASTAFGKLQTQVGKRKGIRPQRKCKVNRAVLLSCLPYSAETYTLYRRHIKRLQRIQMSHLRQLLKISWRERISNSEVRALADMSSVEAIHTQCQLRWTGHVIRMAFDHITTVTHACQPFISSGPCISATLGKGIFISVVD